MSELQNITQYILAISEGEEATESLYDQFKAKGWLSMELEN